MTIARASNRPMMTGEGDNPMAWYGLALLTISYALAYVDRQMLNLLVDPIKTSLDISDTQFSFVQGTAFVTAYLCAAPVFGRLVDVGNRRNILVFGVFVWSLCTALCGLADSYPALFMARLGVGVSEACIVPVSMSLIGDLFAPGRMARAQSIFYIGVQLGGGISLLAGGLVIAFADELRGHVGALAGLTTWQMAFVIIGLPGLLYAIFLFTFREPARRQSMVDDESTRQMTMRDVIVLLWERRHFYGRIYIAIGLIGIVQLGMPSWFPSFLIRTHGVSAEQTGLQLGLLSISAGTIGTLLGPAGARWLERRGYVDAQLRASALALILMLASCFAIPLAPGRIGALTAAAGVFFSCGFPLGIVAAATQNASPGRMRGVVASLYSFFAQLIGYMIGPTLIALCTDRVFGDPKMVGYSMQIVMSCASLGACLLMFSVLPHFRALLSGSGRTS